MKIDDALNSSFKSSLHRAIVNIKYTSNFIGQSHSQFMTQFDLSMAQFNILRILRGAKKAIAVSVVKDRMVEKSPNTTRLMDKLMDKGLISRNRCKEDRRVVYVEINKKGLDLLAKIDVALEENKMFSESNLSDDELETLSALLDKIRG